ncbi:hypothetical protein Golomagni_06259, partial [Golovinomyces magnicellulatus]
VVNEAKHSNSLAKAIKEAGVSLNDNTPASDTPSEEDYDDNVRPSFTGDGEGLRLKQANLQSASDAIETIFRRDSGVHILDDHGGDIQELLKRSSEQIRTSRVQTKHRFRDFVFTKQFSAFDSHNEASANSPFHGFYNLFWLAVALFVLRISIINWYNYGTVLGSSDIMKTMFRRDVVVLLLSDGVMCGMTGVSWLLQQAIALEYISWSRTGWIFQSFWQMAFISGVISWTFIRDWPWTHTVFFVLHGIVMLMKQHSYSFYNGYLSSILLKRRSLVGKLKKLETLDQPNSSSATSSFASSISPDKFQSLDSPKARKESSSKPFSTDDKDIDEISRAISSEKALGTAQISLFQKILSCEIDALSDDLRGTAHDDSRAYPKNLTFIDHYKWIPLPTLVYELEYPRTESTSWPYVCEKLTAMVGILFVMVQVSQYYIYPVVMRTIAMKETNIPLADRVLAFPSMLSDLIFPFMMEYMLVWYLIWETILNVLAELTYFADRNFYDAWWNSVSWDQFARDWNRPVHVFLLRHVYHSSISSMKVNKHTATLITFFLSACIHELVMWCLFKKLRGYLLCLQMCQLPLVRLSRTRWLGGKKTLGNLIFWLGIFTGPSLLCSLYLIL